MNISELIRSNFTKIKKAGEKKLSKNLLTNCMWVMIDETDVETLFIFKENNTLLISINGKITRCTYEFIIDNDTIIINDTVEEVLYYLAMIGDDFLVLNHSYENMVMAFANKTKFKDHLKKVLKLIFEEKINPYLGTSVARSKNQLPTREIEVEANYSTENILYRVKSDSESQYNRGHYSLALESCNKVLEIQPDEMECRVRKCLCLAKLGYGSECYEELDHHKSFYNTFAGQSRIETLFSFYMLCCEALIKKDKWDSAKKIADHFFRHHLFFPDTDLTSFDIVVLTAIYSHHNRMDKIYDMFHNMSESNGRYFHKKLNCL